MEPIEQSPNSSSLSASFGLSYGVTPDARLLAVLYNSIEELKQKVHDLETQKILDETQMPEELLKERGFLPFRGPRFKRGRGYRPILQSEIIEAKQHAKSASAVARWLGVSYSTYKHWATQYGLFESHPKIRGKIIGQNPESGKYPLSKILRGELNDNVMVTDWMVKYKLIVGGVLPLSCGICGYDKRRITDGKVGLLMDHKDGNLRNFCKDNLQFLCWNCMWECGRGYIRKGKHMFDPDWVQGALNSRIK